MKLVCILPVTMDTPSNRNQYASTLLIIWVSTSPLAVLQSKDASLIDYAVAFWALHRLGAIAT